MARKGREISSTGMYHVILRSKTNLFQNDKDYQEFFNCLSRYFSGPCELYAYSLEKNKIHLALYTKESLSSVLKPLCTSYARYSNRIHNTTGRLFYDRYISKPIENAKELSEIVRFISNKPADYTSYEEYKNSPKFCNTTKIENDKITNQGIILPYTDDYSSMSDIQLKKFVLYCFNKNTTVKKTEINDIILNACKNSNISKSRLYRIFEKSPKPNTDIIKTKKEDTKPKKQELSVWLL